MTFLSATIATVAKSASSQQQVQVAESELWAGIGSRIEALRLAKNITHAQLAKAVKLSRSYVTRVINGKRRNANLLPRFARALGVRVSDLFPTGDAQVAGSTAMSDPDRTVPVDANAGAYAVKTTHGAVVAEQLDEVMTKLDMQGRKALMNELLDVIEKATRHPSKRAAE